MSILSSLLFFRGLFIAIFVAFVLRVIWEYDYERILEEEYREDQRSRVTLSWSDVDIFLPPLLGDVRLERMRLNEFLTKKMFTCENEVRLGNDDREPYILCGEVENTGQAVSITGDAQATGIVESSIIADKWIVFAPEESAIIDKLKGDVEVNYLTELQEWKNWHTWDFELNLKNKTFDVVKLDLYTHFFNEHDQPKLIKKLIQLFETKFLLLNIAVGSKEDGEYEEVVGAWYRLLTYLFYSKNYVLIGAATRGICGKVYQNCNYHVSLMRVDDLSTIKKAPSFGLGSPLEEKHRLMVFLRKIPSDCHLVRNADFPPFCKRIRKRDSILIISHNQTLQVPPELREAKHIEVVSPYQTRGSHSDLDNDLNWKYKRLEEMLENKKSLDLLVIDINGAEWDFVSQLDEIVKKARIEEIVINGRIFHEENENYRDFFWHLHRITLAGYKKEFGRVHTPRFSVGLKRVEM